MVITVKRLAWVILIIVILITIFRSQFAWLADFLINPSESVPDPSQIDLPVVNQFKETA